MPKRRAGRTAVGSAVTAAAVAAGAMATAMVTRDWVGLEAAFLFLLLPGTTLFVTAALIVAVALHRRWRHARGGAVALFVPTFFVSAALGIDVFQRSLEPRNADVPPLPARDLLFPFAALASSLVVLVAVTRSRRRQE